MAIVAAQFNSRDPFFCWIGTSDVKNRDQDKRLRHLVNGRMNEILKWPRTCDIYPYMEHWRRFDIEINDEDAASEGANVLVAQADSALYQPSLFENMADDLRNWATVSRSYTHIRIYIYARIYIRTHIRIYI